MAHYAKVNNGIVEQVIVAEVDFFDTFVDSSPGLWVELDTTGIKRASIGYTYNSTNTGFYPPQTHPSWTLNEDTCLWESPVSYPSDDKHYTWDEETTNWKEIT
jgi:hypothetical protein